MDNNQLNASSQEIDVMIVIDTDYVKDYIKAKGLTPSTDKNHAVAIDHKSQYMVVPSAHVVAGQATADLNFKGRAGDTVCFRGSSVSQNSDDSIIIYRVEKYGGVDVFYGNPFEYEFVDRTSAAVPNPKSSDRDGMPSVPGNVTFASLDARIGHIGTGNYYIYFGLYTLDPNDSSKQILYSYCYWDPTITVQ
nr:inclusion body family protein [uncultured Chryseobacterium sp.]